MLQDQIRTLRKAANLSQRQLAQKIGMSQQALAKYENGQATPNPTTLSELAHVLGVSVDHLLGNRTDDAIRVPVLGQVAAGIPIEAVEEVEGEVLLPREMDDEEYFALRIHGQSMEPRMMEGDIVIVRQQQDVESGQIAVVLVGNESATCKRVQKGRDGLTLISINPLFEPMFFSAEQVQRLPIRILGRVIELRARY